MITGIPFDFGNGQEYIIPALSLGALQVYGERIAKVDGRFLEEPSQLDTILTVALAAINRNYPEMTRSDLEELVDISNVMAVWQCVMDAGGLKRKALEESAATGESKPVRAKK